MWLKTHRLVWILGFAAAIAAVVQFALEANLLVLLLALCSIACGLFGFWLFGIFNLAGWISLTYMAGNVLIAFFAKTLLFQRLDSNLVAPRMSFLVQAICGLAMLCALILAVWVDVGKPLMPPITDLTTLRLMSIWCLAIGFGVNLIQIFVARLGDATYGGLNIFGSLFYLGIITRTALLMLRSDGQRMIDLTLFGVLAVATLSGVLSTGKSELAFPWVCFFTTILFFKGKLPWRYMIVLAVGIAVYLAITPIMLTFRYMGLRQMPLDKEVEFLETMPLLDKDELALLAAKHAHTKSLAYDYYGGGGQGQLILGRFSSIQQIDPIIAATDIRGARGGQIFVDGFRTIVPKFFDADKLQQTIGYELIKAQGVYRGGGGHPTVPLAAMVYSAYGLEGIIWIPFVTFFVYLLILKKLCWDIRGNVFAIFLLTGQALGIHSAGFDHFVQISLRGLPLLCVTVIFMQKLAIYLTLRQRVLSNRIGI